MRLDKRFLTHTSRGENYMVSTGDTDFKGIVKNNSTAAFIIECLKEETTESIIADRILAEYEGAERSVVERDVANIIAKLRTIGAIEE